MNYDVEIKLGLKSISLTEPTYFIADLASNHDGDLERAKELIFLAKQAGADAVKFQHFKAEKIVSDYGFKRMGAQIGHQSKWGKSVFDVYKECEYNRDWDEELFETANKIGIDFMTTPYDVEAVERVDDIVHTYKIGSGDITWIDFIEFVAKKNKPICLATGAADMKDVERAVEAVLKYNRQIVLMQCNTNYSGSLENFRYVNLNVLRTFAIHYPGMLLGLSDHAPGHAAVLGAITLGARVIEKHFTSDNSRVGPDHAFSMNPVTWKDMVKRSRELEFALGDGIKRIEENEKDTVIVQQRSVRITRDMSANETITSDVVECLRPAPVGAVLPYELPFIIGKKLVTEKPCGATIFWNDLED